MNPLSRRRTAALTAGLVLLALAAPSPAAGEKAVDAKALDRYLYTSLRDVINQGVELYNRGDVDGCYQHFRQSLKDLDPVLAHRPDLQKAIKDGLDMAEKDPDWRAKAAAKAGMPNPELAPPDRQKAFALRAVFNDVRAGLKGETKPVDKPKDEFGAIDGKVRLDGKALAKGKVTLSRGGEKAVAADVTDGSFKLAKVPPGKYQVAVSGAGIPAKYGDPKTSGIDTTVAKGANLLDIPIKGEPKPAGDTGTVEGTARLDANPLAKGKVTVTADADGKSYSANVTDGKFKFDSLPVGKYKVAITGAGVPASYGDPKTSDLTLTVVKGLTQTGFLAKTPTKPEDKPKIDPNLGTIDGLVNFKTGPKGLLAKGKLTAHDKDGKTYTSDVKDGEYKLVNMPIGKYKVTITGEGVGAKYTDVKTTPLTLEIKKKGNNVPMSYGDVSEKPTDKPKPEGDTGSLSGLVNLDGKLLPKGTITLTGEDKKGHTADVKDGKYKFEGLSPGKYTASFSGDGIPAKYADAKTSNFTATVKKGSNTNSFAVFSEPKPKPEPTLGSISGLVTLDGKKLAKGKVTATDKDGKTYSGDIKEGHYKVEDMPPGKYGVSITGEGVPAKAGDPKKSGYKWDIIKGDNVPWSYNLKSDKPQDKPKPEDKPKEGGTVKGKVTLDGKAVTSGGVNFWDGLPGRSGKFFDAKIGKDGGYELGAAAPLVPGRYMVLISGPDVPKKYAESDGAPRVVEVKPGANALDFALKSERKVPEAVAVPAGNKALGELWAEGEQQYKAKPKAAGGFEWALVGPDATLTDEEGGKKVGKHYGSKDGPVWEIDQITVTGKVPPKSAPAKEGNLPWLLLEVKDVKVKGDQKLPFTLTYVQRVDTEGGVAPAKAPQKETDEVKVKYKATYGFYVADKKPEDKKGDTGTVSGKVTYKGKPLPGGTVTFTRAKNFNYHGSIKADGKYAMPEMPAGEYVVTIETESLKPAAPPKTGDKALPPGKDEKPKADAGKYVAIPADYANPEKSGLKCTVTKGEQAHDIELK